MVQGVKISEDLAWTILRMALRGCPVEEIVADTNVSKRSVERIVERFKKTGMVVSDPQFHLPRGRPKEYDRTDLQVSNIILHSSITED